MFLILFCATNIPLNRFKSFLFLLCFQLVLQSRSSNSSSTPLTSVRAHMRKSVVGGRAWQLRAWLRVLCRWVADDAARQCGLLVRSHHRSSPRWSRMKEERSAEHDHGSSERSVVAEAAVTSAYTREFVKGESESRSKSPPCSPRIAHPHP